MPGWLVPAVGAFWLDQHSGSVVAGATVILAIITAFYVVLTRRLAKASKSLASSSEKLVQETRTANQLANAANSVSTQAVQMEMEDRKRRQAGLFSAWAKTGYQASEGRTFVLVHYKNASAQPMRDCFFRVLVRGGEYHGEALMVEPGYEADLLVDIGAPPALGERSNLDVMFTDNAGVRWHRDPAGVMEQIPTALPPE